MKNLIDRFDELNEKGIHVEWTYTLEYITAKFRKGYNSCEITMNYNQPEDECYKLINTVEDYFESLSKLKIISWTKLN